MILALHRPCLAALPAQAAEDRKILGPHEFERLVTGTTDPVPKPGPGIMGAKNTWTTAACAGRSSTANAPWKAHGMPQGSQICFAYEDYPVRCNAGSSICAATGVWSHFSTTIQKPRNWWNSPAATPRFTAWGRKSGPERAKSGTDFGPDFVTKSDTENGSFSAPRCEPPVLELDLQSARAPPRLIHPRHNTGPVAHNRKPPRQGRLDNPMLRRVRSKAASRSESVAAGAPRNEASSRGASRSQRRLCVSLLYPFFQPSRSADAFARFSNRSRAFASTAPVSPRPNRCAAAVPAPRPSRPSLVPASTPGRRPGRLLQQSRPACARP